MALAPRLDLRQSQTLVMTPQLQQAIKLLALSNLEIEAFVAQELERNPLLDVANDDGEVQAEDAKLRTEMPIATSDQVMDGNGTAAADALDADYSADTFHHDCVNDAPDGAGDGFTAPDMAYSGESGGSLTWNEDGPDFDRFASPEIGLSDHLIAQARAALTGKPLALVHALIDQLEPTGYLGEDLRTFAERIGVTRVEAESALTQLQQFDPIGVGARSLSECLTLQAKDADRYDPAMASLLDNLDLLAKGALPQLRRICGVDEDDLRDMIAELRAYDPKPGLRFDSETTRTVVPDIFVSESKGKWLVELNSATMPRVLVNQSYFAQISKNGHDKATKSWLNECLSDANWLIRALDQRQRTIIKVASEIVKHQQSFFERGVAFLKPLTLRQVAETIEMHESTISRVTSNKYLACSRGVYELKFFFTSGVASSEGGDAISASAVKAAIKTLIDKEDPRAILSDDTLVDMLKEQGFDLARRTVAKYREAIGLGSSVQRRRQKALAG